MRTELIPLPEGFEGKISFKVPSRGAKFRFIMKNYSPTASEFENAKLLEKYTLWANELCEVDLKHISGVVFKSFLEMDEDSDCDELCDLIIKKITLVPQLGEQSVKS